jgi:tetratricopeptide (TPR) repeat protein
LGQVTATMALCAVTAMCGATERTRSIATELRELAGRSGLRPFGPLAESHTAEACWDSVPLEELSEVLEPYLQAERALNRFYARLILAFALARAGRYEEAAVEARGVLTREDNAEGQLAIAARAPLALVALGQGDPSASLEHAQVVANSEGQATLVRCIALVTRAEALFALGRVAEANEAIDEARLFVLAVGSGLEPELREAWLGRHYCARTLKLAAEWVDGVG